MPPCFDIIEADDRDMSCVVSSLVQVMCDPHCRTQHGFQSLVQKEWVMAGHRFYSRINYHRDNDKEEVRGQDSHLICTGLQCNSATTNCCVLFLKDATVTKLTNPQTLLPVPVGSSLSALPGLCMAAVVSVSLPLPADRWIPVGFARQHPPATLLQLPGQLPAREMQTLPGTRRLRGAVASSVWLLHIKILKNLLCEIYQDYNTWS